MHASFCEETCFLPPMNRVLLGHARLFLAILIGLAALALLPNWADRPRGIMAWDIAAASYIMMMALTFATCPPARMPANARAQEDGEWTLFFLVLAGIVISFAAILGEFSSMKDATAAAKGMKVGLVAATLVLSWLLAQVVFALRYAHEYYNGPPGGPVDAGLIFPSEPEPDYWDFVYFSVVLGMTFQVSDVNITARKFRRLATLHGLLGFVFNTVIIALTVNLASGLL